MGRPIHHKTLNDSHVGVTYHIASRSKSFGEDEEEILETPNEADEHTKNVEQDWDNYLQACV